jgi:peptide deformylase
MILPIVYYGNKLLRAKCLPVEKIDEDLVKLVQDMIETMDAKKGIGISAPQVGHLLRLFVLRNYVEKNGKTEFSEPLVYINPKILSPSKEEVEEEEGCLSIPGIRESVLRPYSIVIEATNLQGELFQEEVFGYNARVRMHENDHINGTLFIDRLPKIKRKKLEPLLKQIETRYNTSM